MHHAIDGPEDCQSHAAEKPYTMFDGDGLSIAPRKKGNSSPLAHNQETSLADARERKASARQQFAAVPGTLLPRIGNKYPPQLQHDTSSIILPRSLSGWLVYMAVIKK
jgi:hypothetical protein